MGEGDKHRPQVRGDPSAYARYLQGMDASMRQKVALTAAHLLATGTIADMGMGSATGSEALAALYPQLEVIAIDLDETAVAMASRRYRRPNLHFVRADIATQVFADGSLDGIFDSSVLHHVTSYNGYDEKAAASALAAHARQLRPGGMLIVRDFVKPGAGTVLLDLPDNDGTGQAEFQCSTARLFEHFSGCFRALAARPGFAYERLAPPFTPPLADGWQRFRTRRDLACEFVLRKDYRHDWLLEAKEEYGVFSQPDFERIFAELGLRRLASVPLRNPWIVRHRFTGHFVLRDAQGRELEDPATNYLIVGEKVATGAGVAIAETRRLPPLGFLQLESVRDLRDGTLRDLVRRPNVTIDILPWFSLAGEHFVLARMSYPRPLLAVEREGDRPLDESTPPTYVSEPLSVIQTDKPLGLTVEEALLARAGIVAGNVRGMLPGQHYYPSPGGILEEVQAVLVEIAPLLVNERIGNTSGFDSAGRIRAIELCQLLRAAQVGGLPDARLANNAYDLLARMKADPGPWIGDAVDLADRPQPDPAMELDELLRRPPRRRFQAAPAGARAGFLDLVCAEFSETNAAGKEVAWRTLEYVLPHAFSRNSLSCALLRRSGGEVWLGVVDDDFPAAQCFNGNSRLLVAPAWRLPQDVRGMRAAQAFLREHLRVELAVDCGQLWPLGGAYYPTPGLTPEVVFPFAVEVLDADPGPVPLCWCRLAEWVEKRATIRDGHLLTIVWRAAHALGLLGPTTP